MIRRSIVAALVVFATVWGGAASAAPKELTVRLHPVAVMQDADTVLVRVSAVCPSGLQLLEGLVYVIQDDAESQFAGVHPPCDGRMHHLTIAVHAFEETPFHPGRARATAYLLAYTEDGEDTVDAGDTGRILIRG